MNNNAAQVLAVLPDSLVIELQAIANETRLNSWRIGAVTNDIIALVEENQALYPDFGRMDVYEAVSVALEREYTARSVRDFAFVEGSFSEAERYQYSDLPFSHFRFAASLGGDRRLACLEIASHRLGEKGKPPSVEWLYGQFFGAPPPPPDLSGAVGHMESEFADHAVSEAQALITGETKTYLEDIGIPVEFEAAYSVFQEAVTKLSVPEWVKLRLSRLLDEIRRLLIDNLIRK